MPWLLPPPPPAVAPRSKVDADAPESNADQCRVCTPRGAPYIVFTSFFSCSYGKLPGTNNLQVISAGKNI
jgi:hypothetical protein